MRATVPLLALTVGMGKLSLAAGQAGAQLLIVGSDEKVSFDENTGKTVTHPAGKDTVSIRHEHSYAALLKSDGKTVRKVAQADVGGLAEGIAFSPDGRFLYVGNFVDGDIDVLRRDGDALIKIDSLALAGHPASMRGSTP